MITPGKREVVITGDDLGLRPDWDHAIFEAFDFGSVTSTSVATNGATYVAAASTLVNRGLDCGVHLNLLHGRPLSPPSEVRSLVDADGSFPGSVARVLLAYACRRLRLEEIAREWSRQVERAVSDGLRPTHLNGHFHLHLLPRLFPIARDLARRFDIPWIRLPDEAPADAAGLTATARGIALSRLCRRARARQAMHEPALISCRGVGFSGGLDDDAWERILQRLPTGATPVEVMCHPGQTPRESAALRSPALLHKLRSQCHLRSFGELPLPDGTCR